MQNKASNCKHHELHAGWRQKMSSILSPALIMLEANRPLSQFQLPQNLLNKLLSAKFTVLGDLADVSALELSRGLLTTQVELTPKEAGIPPRDAVSVFKVSFHSGWVNIARLFHMIYDRHFRLTLILVWTDKPF